MMLRTGRHEWVRDRSGVQRLYEIMKSDARPEAKARLILDKMAADEARAEASEARWSADTAATGGEE